MISMMFPGVYYPSINLVIAYLVHSYYAVKSVFQCIYMLLWVFRFAIKVGDFVAVNVPPADMALAKAKVYL